jgi:hypothetical protein
LPQVRLHAFRPTMAKRLQKITESQELEISRTGLQGIRFEAGREESLMELWHLRHTYAIGYTFAQFKIQDWTCDLLEDEVRKEGHKVYGETALPFGTHRIVMEHSAKFDKVLPEFKDMKQFTEAKYHSGAIPEHTLGCPLVGRGYRIESGKATLWNGRKTEAEMLDLLGPAGTEHIVHIVNVHEGMEWRR